MSKTKTNRPLWQEILSQRQQQVAKQEEDAKAWERGAEKKLREAVEACLFYGFHVTPIDALTISIVPEDLHNEFVNVDESSIRVVRPEEDGHWTYDNDYAFEVTFAPSVRKMLEPTLGPYDDPPRDDEEPKLEPEPPEVVHLDVPQGNYYRNVKQKLEGVLVDIIQRLIDLKHPELVLKKED